MSVASIKASYVRGLGKFETVTIRRFTGSGPNRPKFEVDVRARVTGFAPQEMIGGIQQGDRKCILLHDDLVAAGLALPITNQDFAVVQGKQHAIRVPDNATRRVEGVTIAYELQIVG
ncbi:MAG: hypothetical protein Q8M26_08735 [Pseudolabrys sp.]|nr:hypothetical protein [Pseudolabrys sp.]